MAFLTDRLQRLREDAKYFLEYAFPKSYRSYDAASHTHTVTNGRKVAVVEPAEDGRVTVSLGKTVFGDQTKAGLGLIMAEDVRKKFKSSATVTPGNAVDLVTRHTGASREKVSESYEYLYGI